MVGSPPEPRCDTYHVRAGVGIRSGAPALSGPCLGSRPARRCPGSGRMNGGFCLRKRFYQAPLLPADNTRDPRTLPAQQEVIASDGAVDTATSPRQRAAGRTAGFAGGPDAVVTAAPRQRRAVDDPAVLSEVESLLRAALARRRLPAHACALRPLGSAFPQAATGMLLGAWRVTGIIGRGGMGEVYQATRAQGDFGEQRGAIKLLQHRRPARNWSGSTPNARSLRGSNTRESPACTTVA